MGKFIVSVRKNGEYQFNLKADNGQVILTSEGYTTKASCLNGIESVKKMLPRTNITTAKQPPTESFTSTSRRQTARSLGQVKCIMKRPGGKMGSSRLKGTHLLQP